MKLGTSYLNADNAKKSDTIKFLDEGEWVTSDKYKYADGNPKKDLVFTIEHNGEEKSFRLNGENRKILQKQWGNETKDWVNKVAVIAEIATYRQLGTKGIVLDGTAWEE